MRNIIIVGSGAVAAELTSYIEDNNNHILNENQLKIAGYLEFENNITKYWSRYKFKQPVLGDVNSYTIQKDDHFIIAVADIDFRNKMINHLKAKNGRIIGFTHYTSIIASSAAIGIGNIIYPHCIIGPNATIGDYNLFTSYSFISHDSVIGNSNLFSTSGIGGNVKIGNNNFLGIRSTILPGISVGDRNIIQAGMIVDKNLEDDCTIFHRFKEKVIAIKTGNNNE
jgi:acetyltransferase-like isoleucine patch superfamily enzyme